MREWEDDLCLHKSASPLQQVRCGGICNLGQFSRVARWEAGSKAAEIMSSGSCQETINVPHILSRSEQRFELFSSVSSSALQQNLVRAGFKLDFLSLLSRKEFTVAFPLIRSLASPKARDLLPGSQPLLSSVWITTSSSAGKGTQALFHDKHSLLLQSKRKCVSTQNLHKHEDQHY